MSALLERFRAWRAYRAQRLRVLARGRTTMRRALRSVWPSNYVPCPYAGSEVFFCTLCDSYGVDQHTWRYAAAPSPYERDAHGGGR